MPLTKERIEATTDDDQLLDLLSEELNLRFPEVIQEDADLLLAALKSAPNGLRAMAGTHLLDVSLTMDDLAWHFGNQQNEALIQETSSGLRELELPEIASLFDKAASLVRPFLPAIARAEFGDDFSGWLEQQGIQQQVDPLDKEMRAAVDALGENGILSQWVTYARKYPERLT